MQRHNYYYILVLSSTTCFCMSQTPQTAGFLFIFYIFLSFFVYSIFLYIFNLPVCFYSIFLYVFQSFNVLDLSLCFLLSFSTIFAYLLFWLFRALCVSIIWLPAKQCDLIFRNFTTLSKVYKPLEIFWQFISYLAKCWAYCSKFVTLLGYFS